MTVLTGIPKLLITLRYEYNESLIVHLQQVYITYTLFINTIIQKQSMVRRIKPRKRHHTDKAIPKSTTTPMLNICTSKVVDSALIVWCQQLFSATKGYAVTLKGTLSLEDNNSVFKGESSAIVWLLEWLAIFYELKNAQINLTNMITNINIDHSNVLGNYSDDSKINNSSGMTDTWDNDRHTFDLIVKVSINMHHLSHQKTTFRSHGKFKSYLRTPQIPDWTDANVWSKHSKSDVVSTSDLEYYFCYRTFQCI